MKVEKHLDKEEVQYSNPESLKIHAHRVAQKQYFVDKDGIVLTYNPRTID